MYSIHPGTPGSISCFFNPVIIRIFTPTTPPNKILGMSTISIETPLLIHLTSKSADPDGCLIIKLTTDIVLKKQEHGELVHIGERAVVLHKYTGFKSLSLPIGVAIRAPITNLEFSLKLYFSPLTRAPETMLFSAVKDKPMKIALHQQCGGIVSVIVLAIAREGISGREDTPATTQTLDPMDS